MFSKNKFSDDKERPFVANLHDCLLCYRLALLSDFPQEKCVALNYSDQFSGWELADAFGVISFSYETQRLKSDPRVYRAVVEQLGFHEEECVMIDDSTKNCEMARSVGMQVIHFKSARDLEHLL